MANNQSSDSSELHAAVALVETPSQQESASSYTPVRRRESSRSRDVDRTRYVRSRSMGPAVGSPHSVVSNMEAGKLDQGQTPGVYHHFSEARALNVVNQLSQANVDARSICVQQGLSPQEHIELSSRFADQVRNATMEEAEVRHQRILGETLQSMVGDTQHSIEEVRRVTREEAEDRHRRILEDSLSEANSNAQSRHDQAMTQLHQRFQRELESLKAQYEKQLTDMNSQVSLLASKNEALRLELAESSRPSRALPAGGEENVGFVGLESMSGQGGFPTRIFEPIPKTSAEVVKESSSSRSNDESIANCLAVLQEQVQDLTEQLNRRKASSRHGRKGGETSSSSSESDEEPKDYKEERKLMRTKAYEKLRVSSLPKSAAEMRTWKNSLVSQLGTFCRSSEAPLMRWISNALDGKESEEVDLSFPVLDRVLGSKLLEAGKGSRFSVDFQSLQERSYRKGLQVSGLTLLSKICRKFMLDKERGMSLSQQHLLALKPQGAEIKDLEVFRDRVEFVLAALDEDERPAEGIMRTWIYECLKNIPKLALKIDKYRESEVGSIV